MTRSTVVPTNSGIAISGNVRPRTGRINYAAPDPVAILATAFGWIRATAEQRLKFSDDRNPGPLLAAMCRVLIEKGRPDVAEKLRAPVNLICDHYRPQPATLELLCEVEAKDNREDADENALRLVDPTLALDTEEAQQTALRLAKSKEDAAREELVAAAALRVAVAAKRGRV